MVRFVHIKRYRCHLNLWASVIAHAGLHGGVGTGEEKQHAKASSGEENHGQPQVMTEGEAKNHGREKPDAAECECSRLVAMAENSLLSLARAVRVRVCKWQGLRRLRWNPLK